jgi:hypothetical protein
MAHGWPCRVLPFLLAAVQFGTNAQQLDFCLRYHIRFFIYLLSWGYKLIELNLLENTQDLSQTIHGYSGLLLQSLQGSDLLEPAYDLLLQRCKFDLAQLNL